MTTPVAENFELLARQAVSDHRRRRWAVLRLMLLNKVTALSTAVLLIMTLTALFAPWIAPFPEQGAGAVNLAERLQPASWDHLLGTDTYGRDLLSRVMYGARISIFGGLMIVIIAALLGVPLGLWAGYQEGFSGMVITKVVELVLSFPAVLLAMGISILAGAGFATAVIALIIPWWPWYTRLAQGEAARIKHMQFIEAARMLGYGRIYVLFRHILPNILTPVIVMMLLDFGPAIIAIGLLSFLGLGTQPPSADWGLMVWEGAPNILTQWWIAVVPGSAMFILVSASNIFGDRLKELLDSEL